MRVRCPTAFEDTETAKRGAVQDGGRVHVTKDLALGIVVLNAN